MGLLSDFFGVECEHKHKKCIELNYAKSNNSLVRNGEEIEHVHASVELWECNDCNNKFLVNWGDNSFKVYNER